MRKAMKLLGFTALGLIGAVAAAYAAGMKFSGTNLTSGETQALNSTLAGTGLSFDLTGEGPAQVLTANADFATSNMRFTLNIVSTGSDGINIVAPNGQSLNVQVDDNMGFTLTLSND